MEAFPLYIVCNKSIKLTTFSVRWKESYIVPIDKNGCKSNIENYRGILILFVVRKLFEAIVHDKL